MPPKTAPPTHGIAVSIFGSGEYNDGKRNCHDFIADAVARLEENGLIGKGAAAFWSAQRYKQTKDVLRSLGAAGRPWIPKTPQASTGGQPAARFRDAAEERVTGKLNIGRFEGTTVNRGGPKAGRK